MNMDLPADWELGSFTERAPWVLAPEQLPWRRGIDVLRLATLRQIPALTTRRAIPPIGRLVVVVGHLLRALVPWALRDRRHGGSVSRAGLSRRLRVAVERLGPTYIKLAQIVSSGEGIVPAELVEEMKKCRDQVPAETFETVRSVLVAELGDLDSVFSSLDPTPLAAASIAQVHRATLRSGEDVVVKVQRPTIRTQVQRDLRVMAWIAPMLVGRIPVTALANPPALVELFAETISEELDFRLEAQNMLDLAAVFAAVGERGYVVPRPHPSLVTRRALVMERFEGFAFDDVALMHAEGIDTEEVVRVGMRGFTVGCMIHGIFHGDLHGGNLLVLADGRIGLLDFGITARMSPIQRSAFLKLMMTGAAGDVRGQLEAFRDLGALPTDTDLEQVYVDLGLDQAPVDPTTMDPDQLVSEIQHVIKALLGYGARLPKILMLYVKNLMFLDGAIARLAPNLDILGEFANLSLHMATAYGDHIAADMGVDAGDIQVSPEAIKATFGIVDPDVTQVTYADLQARREVIRRRIKRQ
ncbi:MAG: AarF/ABC1/UbiB kinase family protein [Microthrixaceae bacterium]|nr:AarF/ABC1/UbiB kinase family protein [Microthrixaceae bacterium]